MSLYSYSYSYEPDNNSLNQSFLSTTYDQNNSTYINSPKRRNVIYDKETNKYKKTMVSSSDDEQEYNDYKNKVMNIKQIGPRDSRRKGEYEFNYNLTEPNNKFDAFGFIRNIKK